MRHEITGHLSDPSEAWRILADTDYMNRVAFQPTVPKQAMVAAPDGLRVIEGAFDSPLGEIRFTEPVSSWVQGRWYRQERQIHHPLWVRSVYELYLEPEAGGVVPRIVVETDFSGALANAAGRYLTGRVTAAWKGVLDKLPAPQAPRVPDRRALDASTVALLKRWEAESGVVASATRELFETGSATDLNRMRPWHLADRWGLDRDEVLEAFLTGTQQGLLELYWSVRCPRCRSQVQGTGSLSDVADHAHCTSCKIDVVTDLGTHVEVLFAPHPGLVPRLEESFCTMFPRASPDILATLVLDPGQVREELVPLEAGRYRIGASGGPGDAGLHALPEGDARVPWSTRAGADELRLRSATGTVAFENAGQERVRVQVFPIDSAEVPIPASRLTTMPSFRARFGHQVLSKDHRLAVREVTLLFTDLTGSTAMYEELGDARAYAVVRDHFVVLRQVVELHGGVIVKTIGDAVMAAFHTPLVGLKAGFAMQRAFQAWAQGLDLHRPLGLRVGFHAGPALVVHSDGTGVDYFGQAVNLSARAQGAAEADEVVWTEAVDGWPGVREWLAENTVSAERTAVPLKGLREPVPLHRARVARGDG